MPSDNHETRSSKKPVLQYAHERLCDANVEKGDFWENKYTAENITERIPPFVESDGDMRPVMPPNNWMIAQDLTFDEYSKILAPVFKMKREHGIVEARAHTDGGGLVWGLTPHSYIHKMFEYVGADRDAEVLIFGSSGKNFFESIGPRDCYRDTSKPFEPMNEEDKEHNWILYDHQYYDGTHDIESEVNIDIPTIGIWHGGSFHSDLFLLCDITIATEDAWTTDTHFRLNMVPGDGIQIPWRMLMGQKRFAYAELTGEIITARKALQYGMVNEIVPDLESAYKRAWEIAELIMRSGTRQTRRLTTQIIRKPVKEAVANELRGSFSTEMWNTLAEESPHHPLYWECAKAEAAAVMAAEKKGKVVKPRIGQFIEEELIK